MKKIIMMIILAAPVIFGQVRIENLLNYEDTTEALRIRKVLPVDAYYYINNAGGTFNGLIDQLSADDAATIIISSNVTANVSYIPSNINLDFTGDGSITNSGVLTIYGDIISPRKKIFNGTVNLTNSKVKEVYPEWWGAVTSDGTDDKTAIKNAFEQSLGKNFSFGSGEYTFNDTLNINLQGYDLLAYGGAETIIQSTKTPKNHNYYNMPGILKFRNGGRVEVRDIMILNTNADTVTQGDNGISIVDCKEIVAENVRSKYAGYCALYVEHANSASFYNCSGDSSMYAGLMVREVYHFTVVDGSYSYNGSYGTVTGTSHYNSGYGIALATKWNISGSVGIENVSISGGVKLFYNYRSAISGHGGTRTYIGGNFITGFGNQGYAPLNYGETGSEGYESLNRNCIIIGNTFEQDSAWVNQIIFRGYADHGEWNADTTYYVNEGVTYNWATWRALRTTVNDTPGSNPLDWEMIVSDAYQGVINVGSYGVTSYYYNIYNPGQFLVSNNIIYKPTSPRLIAVLQGQVNKKTETGSYISAMSFINNTITECYNPIYGAIYIGGDEGAVDNPEAVVLSTNTVNGIGGNALMCLSGKNVSLSENHINGIWTNPLTCTIPHSRNKNTYNGQALADIGLERSYTSYLRDGGKISFHQVTNADTATIQYMTVDNDWTRYYDRSGIVAKVRISGTFYYPTTEIIWEGLVGLGFEGEPINQGVWDSGTSYTINQYVIYGNDYYKSLQTPNLNHNPASEPTYWELFVGTEYATNDTMRAVSNNRSAGNLLPPTIVWHNKGGNKRSLCINFRNDYANYNGTIEWAGGNYATYNDTLFADTLKAPINLVTNTWRDHSKDIGRMLDGNLNGNRYNVTGLDSLEVQGRANIDTAKTNYLGVGTTNYNSRVSIKGTGTTSSTKSLDIIDASNNSILVAKDDKKVKVGMSADASISKTFEVAGSMNFDKVTDVSTADINALVLTENLGGGTLAASNYYYNVAFVTAEGQSSCPTTNPKYITVSANSSVTVSNIPVSSDPRVTARKIYRSNAGDGSAQYYQYYIHTINDNTTTSYTDAGDAGSSTDYSYWKANTTAGTFYSDGTKILEMTPYNTAAGFSANASLTRGYSNTAFGSYANTSVTTGNSNAALGYSTLQTLTTGSDNIGINYAALLGNSTGSGNIAVGSNALRNDYSASYSYNVGAGVFALYNITTGNNFNIAMGYSSGRGFQGTGNITLGGYAGYHSTPGTVGNYNTIIGYNSGLTYGNGADKNILIGYNLEPQSTTADGQLSIGNLIFGTGLGDVTGTTISSGNIGIGLAAPSSKLHVYKSTANYVSKFESGDANNYNQFISTSGTGEYGIWNDNLYFQALSSLQGIYLTNNSGTAGLYVKESTGNVGIGNTSPGAKLHITGAGDEIKLSRSGQTDRFIGLGSGDQFYIGNWSDQTKGLTLLASGNVGVGTTSPAAKLDVSGSFKYGIASSNIYNLAGSTTINWNQGSGAYSTFKDSIADDVDPVYTFSNVVEDAWITVRIYAGNANSVSFPSTGADKVHWIGDTAPTALEANKYNYFQFYKCGWFITGMVIGTTSP